MKTHPDSIFVNATGFTSVSGVGCGECMVSANEPIGVRTLEFVPASAYLEVVRERDEALQRAHDLELTIINEAIRKKLYQVPTSKEDTPPSRSCARRRRRGPQ